MEIKDFFKTFQTLPLTVSVMITLLITNIMTLVICSLKFWEPHACFLCSLNSFETQRIVLPCPPQTHEKLPSALPRPWGAQTLTYQTGPARLMQIRHNWGQRCLGINIKPARLCCSFSNETGADRQRLPQPRQQPVSLFWVQVISSLTQHSSQKRLSRG